MAVQLNHTIINCTDRQRTSTFLTEILGLPEATPYEPFFVVQADNDVSLDVLQVPGPIHPQHYAFLVSETEFDEILGRIKERELGYWADPFHRTPNEINTNDGGRGVYWSDPDGHNLEIITRSYGS